MPVNKGNFELESNVNISKDRKEKATECEDSLSDRVDKQDSLSPQTVWEERNHSGLHSSEEAFIINVKTGELYLSFSSYENSRQGNFIKI